MQKSNKKTTRMFTKNLPLFTEADFPQLQKDPLKHMEPTFKKYLIIKHQDQDKKNVRSGSV